MDGSRIVDAAHADRRRLLPQDAEGNKKPGKTTRITGSELLIIEPEYVLWDDTAQLYPFVFESIGDWDVTTSVAPPEGFIADYEVLEEYVDVTITEVGSDPVPTQTILEVVHNGEYRTILSTVDIKLTADYAESRGFDVDELRAAGLIMEQPTARSTR